MCVCTVEQESGDEEVSESAILFRTREIRGGPVTRKAYNLHVQ